LIPRGRSGRCLSQRPDELAGFIALLRRNHVRSYLEIGARDGDTFYEVMKSLPAGSMGVAVDLPGGPWGRETSSNGLRSSAEELRRLGYDIHLIFGHSRDLGTVDAVRDLGAYDAILIDADHRYEAVAMDWLNYGPMGRLVTFHDIDGDGHKDKAGNQVEVPKLWREIKASGLRIGEIIGREPGMGIGVVYRA
jgi:hypothetical protein